MFVFCNDCHRHYDDSSQSPKCNGIHNKIAPDPAEEHVRNTRRAWDDWIKRNPNRAALRGAQNGTAKALSSRS